MTNRDVVGALIGGGFVLTGAILLHGRSAHANEGAEHARTAWVACDAKDARMLGPDAPREASFAVKEFPGKTAAELARVHALGKLAGAQGAKATFTANVPVLIRDGEVIVECGGDGAAARGVESVMLVLPGATE